MKKRWDTKRGMVEVGVDPKSLAVGVVNEAEHVWVVLVGPLYIYWER